MGELRRMIDEKLKNKGHGCYHDLILFMMVIEIFVIFIWIGFTIGCKP